VEQIHWNEYQWVDIPGAKTTDNSEYDGNRNFEERSVRQLRLLVTQTPDNIARLWEIEFYTVPTAAR